MSTVITAELKLDGSQFKKGAEEAKRGADQVKQSGESLSKGSQSTHGELGKLQQSLGLVSAASNAASGSVAGTASAAVQASRSFAAMGASMKAAMVAGGVVTAAVAIGAALWRAKEAADAAAASVVQMHAEVERTSAERAARDFERMEAAIRRAAEAARALNDEQQRGRSLDADRAQLALRIERDQKMAAAATPEEADAIARDYASRMNRAEGAAGRQAAQNKAEGIQAEIGQTTAERDRLVAERDRLYADSARHGDEGHALEMRASGASWWDRNVHGTQVEGWRDAGRKLLDQGAAESTQAQELRPKIEALDRRLAVLAEELANAGKEGDLATLREQAAEAAAAAAEAARNRAGNDTPKAAAPHAEAARAANSLAAVGGYLSGHSGAMTVEQQQLAETKKQTKTMEDMVAAIREQNEKGGTATWG